MQRLKCKGFVPQIHLKDPTLLVALTIALSLATAPVVAAADLSTVQWDHRVLVLFAESSDAPYGEQQNLLDAVRAGLAERDMLVLGVTGQSVTTLFGDLSGFDVNAVRRTAGRNSAEPFEAVLIGKDGGVKQRWTKPVSPDTLFAIIDAMPMRANEMRRGRTDGQHSNRAESRIGNQRYRSR